MQAYNSLAESFVAMETTQKRESYSLGSGWFSSPAALTSEGMASVISRSSLSSWSCCQVRKDTGNFPHHFSCLPMKRVLSNLGRWFCAALPEEQHSRHSVWLSRFFLWLNKCFWRARQPSAGFSHPTGHSRRFVFVPELNKLNYRNVSC